MATVVGEFAETASSLSELWPLQMLYQAEGAAGHSPFLQPPHCCEYVGLEHSAYLSRWIRVLSGTHLALFCPGSDFMAWVSRRMDCFIA